jgi:hypothetical protein
MHGYESLLPAGLLVIAMPLLIVLAVWCVAIKGYALWKAARHSDKGWFVVLLVVNTLGILELVYLFWYLKNHEHDAPATASDA